MDRVHKCLDGQSLRYNGASGKYYNIIYQLGEVRWSIVVSVPATRSARPGFESLPGGYSPQKDQRGGRLLCEYSANKLIKLGPGWL